jgi:hypothetical protein
MNIRKVKGPEKMLQMTGKCEVQEHKSGFFSNVKISYIYV